MENNNKKKVNWLYIALAVLLVACITMAIILASRSANKAGSDDPIIPEPTITPTVVTPTPTVQPTQKPISNKFELTKSPTNEARDISRGDQTEMLFVAKANNYSWITWYINGQQAVNSNAVSGQGTQVLRINPYLYNNHKSFQVPVYAVFSNGFTTITSGTAYATVTGGYSPTPTPVPGPTSYPIQVIAREGGSVDVVSSAYSGTTVPFAVNAYPGYELVSIQINGVGVGINARSFVMPNSMAVIDAEFEKTSPTPVTTRTIYLTEFGEGGYVSNIPFLAEPGETVYFTLELTNSQAMESVDITCCNSAAKVSFTSSGMIYSFVMPNDDVNVSVGWSIPA